MEAWQTKALELGDILGEAGKTHHELIPLHTSWLNFARKHDVKRQADDTGSLHQLLESHGLTIMPIEQVDRLIKTVAGQTEKIKALERRISRLLRP